MKELLKIKNLRKTFADKEVLHGINLTVNEGEVVSIIGSSGGGKSTLLRCATFLEYATSGEISYDDKKACIDVNGKAQYVSEAELKLLREDVGLVFQNFNLFPHYSVLKNLIDAPISVQKRNKIEVIEEAKNLLEKMGLSDKINDYPQKLSGGQKQRVAIARELMMKPKILFFDEPTSALDPELTKEVLKVIKKLAKEKYTMVIVTHEMMFAKEVSDRIIFIDNGSILEEGSALDLMENPKNERTRQFIKGFIE